MRYAVVTACQNEEAHLPRLVTSVLSQELRPQEWVIVNDGSHDRTGEIARSLTAGTPGITVVDMPRAKSRDFASQVYAQRFGYDLLRSHSFELIAFLDADIQLPTDYYRRVSEAFARRQSLGLAGGLLLDVGAAFHDVRKGSEQFHVPGGIQTFRRQAFDEMGGYSALAFGGQDTVADIMVAMNGWSIEVLSELRALHLRPLGASGASSWQMGASIGRRAYSVAYRPSYLLAHCARRAPRSPMCELGKLWGYFLAALNPRERVAVEPDVAEYFRKVQRRRLYESVRRIL